MRAYRATRVPRACGARRRGRLHARPSPGLTTACRGSGRALCGAQARGAGAAGVQCPSHKVRLGGRMRGARRWRAGGRLVRAGVLCGGERVLFTGRSHRARARACLERGRACSPSSLLARRLVPLSCLLTALFGFGRLLPRQSRACQRALARPCTGTPLPRAPGTLAPDRVTRVRAFRTPARGHTIARARDCAQMRERHNVPVAACYVRACARA